jgi:hypothetical protein
MSGRRLRHLDPGHVDNSRDQDSRMPRSSLAWLGTTRPARPTSRRSQASPAVSSRAHTARLVSLVPPPLLNSLPTYDAFICPRRYQSRAALVTSLNAHSPVRLQLAVASPQSIILANLSLRYCIPVCSGTCHKAFDISLRSVVGLLTHGAGDPTLLGWYSDGHK